MTFVTDDSKHVLKNQQIRVQIYTYDTVYYHQPNVSIHTSEMHQYVTNFNHQRSVHR